MNNQSIWLSINKVKPNQNSYILIINNISLTKMFVLPFHVRRFDKTILNTEDEATANAAQAKLTRSWFTLQLCD
tara:strand:+ start:63 stop:284 length:222 start_codon:yes stop_codon:yes gene_type:complete